MPKHAKFLLNKVINENDTRAFIRHNIQADDMPTEIDRETFKFIEEYAKENGGNAPSYAVVADSVDNFEYIPEVTDSFTWLTKRVKGFAATQAVMKLFETGEFERALNEKDGNEFVEEWLPNVLENVRMRTSVSENVGTNIKTDISKFKDEYNRRKVGDSFNIWKSKFSSVGEYVSGNMYVLFGESGRGKSIFTLEDAIYAAKQGANVLMWNLEMGWYEVMVRIYTSISGDARMIKSMYEGRSVDGGFNARQVRTGQMTEEFEEAFNEFLENISDYIPGSITIRAVDDEDFTDRSLKALQSDIERTDADFVVVDPFYYMDYERNVNKTTGGAAAETSMKMRAITGRADVVLLTLTQAETTGSEESDEGHRELKMPERDHVKKASNLLEDAAILIGVDSDYRQGIGAVGVLKGRDGGEGNLTNVTYLPQFGVVEELEVGEEAMAGFDF